MYVHIVQALITVFKKEHMTYLLHKFIIYI